MKKTSLIIVMFLLTSSYIFAQRGRGGQVKWIDIELKGGYGGSILLNSDISADKNAELAIFSPAYEAGARLGLTYGDYVGIGVEFLTSGFKQDYNITEPVLNKAYTKTQNFKTSDIVVTLKFTSPYGFYFELGPKFSTIKKAEVSNSIIGTFLDDKAPNYQENFSDKFTSIIAGLGFAAYNGDRLKVNIGLRAAYALSSIIKNDNFYAIRDGMYNPTGSYEAKTSPCSVKLMAGVSYTFGFWGNASCGRGRLVFFQ